MRAWAGLPALAKQIDVDDIRLMGQLLTQPTATLNAGPAGTVFRFLLPYLAAQTGRTTVLTGTHRMCQRPIGPLVDALRQLGANIQYLGVDGFPPVQIEGTELSGRTVQVKADVSSQFISSLLMAAPYLANGIEIEVDGAVVSEPYINLTIGLMRQCGAKVVKTKRGWQVNQGKYIFASDGPLPTDPDWTAASYAYALCALRPESTLFLPQLCLQSLQGDRAVTQLFEPLGVETVQAEGGLRIRNTGECGPTAPIFDLSGHPDLAQTLMAVCAGLGLKAQFKGIENLTIKETDRLHAMQTELGKFGVLLSQVNPNTWQIVGKAQPPVEALCTYHDHRMALSLAPLSLVAGPLFVQHPEVVGKSFPRYWDVLAGLGFELCH